MVGGCGWLGWEVPGDEGEECCVDDGGEDKEGDFVLTHKNRYKKVRKVMEQTINEDIFELNVSGVPNKILCTLEHPFYATTYQSVHHSKYEKSEIIFLRNHLIGLGLEIWKKEKEEVITF